MSSGTFTIVPSELNEVIEAAVQGMLPIFIWGPPGIGKSMIVRQCADARGGLLIDLRMAQTEPTDVRGIPFYNKESNRMEWAHPIDLPSEEEAAKYPIVFLFLDELNSAPPAVQAAAYQLVLDRRVGTYVLPENVFIVAAGNRETDRGVTYKMPAPLANRFVHIDVEPDFASWNQWAADSGQHQDIIGYLEFAKEDLFKLDAKSSSKAFRTPRSWSYVDRIIRLTSVSERTKSVMIAGSVSEGTAISFIAHRKHAANLPSAKEILNGDVEKLDRDHEISALYTLTNTIAVELKDMAKGSVSREVFERSCNTLLRFFMDNYTPEMITYAIRTIAVTHKVPLPIAKLGNYRELLEKNKKFLTRQRSDG